MNDISIKSIIDRNLKSWIDKGLNSIPGKVEPEMASPDEPLKTEGWKKWFPINSTVTDAELEDLEIQLNFHLPKSYKTFLKYKHFYELYLSVARFSGHEIRHWRPHLLDMFFSTYPKKNLIDKGYIPFANWSDWGVLCFDTNKSIEENEYPIILWDHEYGDKYEPFSKNFLSLLLKLDSESKTN